MSKNKNNDIFDDFFFTPQPKKSGKRILIKETKLNEKQVGSSLHARVTMIISKSIFVSTKDGQIYNVTISGVLISEHSHSSIVAVGDFVLIKPNLGYFTEEGIPIATIIKIEPRTKVFSRKANGYLPYEQILASNISDVLILSSVSSPVFNTRLIDRILIVSELNNLRPAICINKYDLIEKDKQSISMLNESFEIYRAYGIPLFTISVTKNYNIAQLIDYLKGKETVLIGQSGVGKSSLINLLFGEELQKVNQISSQTQKGKHTTSFISLFNYNNDEFKLIDTPGIREFGIWGLDKQDLSFYFPEFSSFSNQCRYQPCSHTHEPDCKVIEAIENGEISRERYQSYLNIYDSLD
jgi:ribosome biogenesis GTPase